MVSVSVLRQVLSFVVGRENPLRSSWRNVLYGNDFSVMTYKEKGKEVLPNANFSGRIILSLEKDSFILGREPRGIFCVGSMAVLMSLMATKLQLRSL